MIISKQAYQSFLDIKELLENPVLKYTDEQFLKIQEVYSEITNKPLNKGCNSCIETGLKILRNWQVLFEEKTKQVYSEVKPKQTRKKKV